MNRLRIHIDRLDQWWRWSEMRFLYLHLYKVVFNKEMPIKYKFITIYRIIKIKIWLMN